MLPWLLETPIGVRIEWLVMLGKNLKNGIHQWCVGKLVEVLKNKASIPFEISEAYPSSRNPFSERPIKNHAPSMISVALRGVEGEDIKNTDEASKAEQRISRG